MKNVVELKPDEFNEQWLPLFARVHDQYACRCGYRVPGEFNPAFFIKHWQNLMRLNIARTWSVGRHAILGAVFVPIQFTGDTTALISFWDAIEPKTDSIRLLTAVENAARAAGATQLQIGALSNEAHDVISRLYRMNGFKRSETLFTKIL